MDDGDANGQEEEIDELQSEEDVGTPHLRRTTFLD